jgi:hypothetical protein
MNIEMLNNELTKLTQDKTVVEGKLSQYKDEMITLEKNRDYLMGAIQFCNYLINSSKNNEQTVEEPVEENVN